MIKAVIFDMDGVIIDSEPLMDNFYIDYFKKYNIEFDKKVQKILRGVSSEYFWTKLKELYYLPEPIEFYVHEVRYKLVDYLKSLKELKPIDGVTNFIDILKKNNIKTALATSGSKLRMNTILDLIKMQNSFDVKVSAQDVKNAKPEPEIFLLSSKLLGVNPKECIVIEDTTNGIQAAKSAGMTCVGFEQTENDQDLSEADYVVNNFN